MFIHKLEISKKGLNVLAIATGIVIIGILIVISLMSASIKDGYTDLEFFGYKFLASDHNVIIKIPGENPETLEINSESLGGLEHLSKTINKAYINLQSVYRNLIIFAYLLVVLIIIFKKKKTYFQGLFKGLLIGGSLMLLFFTIQGILDINGMLVSFEHDFTHLIF